MTDNEEGKYVADAIKELKLRNHINNQDFAILYRTNAQSRSFEESLRRLGIAYRIYGGTSFYQRKEIKDYLAYLRVIVNTQDEESIKRIINYPTRGIGKTTIEKAVVIANENGINMWKVLEASNSYGFKGNTQESISNFVTMIRYFQSMLTSKNAYDVAFAVGKNTNMVKELFNDKSTEGLARYENIQELLNAIKEWTESPDNDEGELKDKSLGSYLQQITLLTDTDEKNEQADSVKLMTIHAAKGLEFPVVFVGGIEETLFPNSMAINTREELEEERRLFYVAITRAKKKLYLTYANSRYRFGSLVQNEPSRFINEIPNQYLDKSFSGAASRSNNLGSAYERMQRGFGNYGNNPSKNGAGTETERKPSSVLSALPKPKLAEHKVSENFEASDTSQLEAGQKVEHQKFGYGTVSKVDGSAHNPIATIQFELQGEKKNYAELC